VGNFDAHGLGTKRVNDTVSKMEYILYYTLFFIRKRFIRISGWKYQLENKRPFVWNNRILRIFFRLNQKTIFL